MDLSLLREWAPVNDIINKIPSRWLRGMFVTDICLTCIDVISEFIAIGTNAGFAIWYDRKKGDFIRLRCEEPTNLITEIKVVSSVEYMIACGADNGLISIFTIPKEIPPDLIKVEIKTSPPERYCIRDLHTTTITSLEWSKNGMKLFSGDKNGCVVLTEIDFYMHICKSVELVNESYEIVQLSFNNPKLIVSTLFRTIITEQKDLKWEVIQIGRQDRKCLSKLGATFMPSSNLKDNGRIYNCRHGHRLWVAKFDGSVEKTILFKDKLRKPKYIVPLLNPKPKCGKDCLALQPELPNFGIIRTYGQYLLTYNQNVMYLLDPDGPQVLATLSQFRGILSASVNDNEIFILEGPRSLIRISTAPEENLIKADHDIASLMSSSTFFNTLNTKLKAISTISLHLEDDIIDSEIVSRAEECTELPPIERLPHDEFPTLDIQQMNEPQNGLRTKISAFDKINEIDYDENILYKSEIRKKRKTNQPYIDNCKDVKSSTISEEMSKSECSSRIDEQQIDSASLRRNFTIPDLRSPKSILEDIQYKENKLAELLNLEKITIPPKQEHQEKDSERKFMEDFQKVLQLPDISFEEPKPKNAFEEDITRNQSNHDDKNTELNFLDTYTAEKSFGFSKIGSKFDQIIKQEDSTNNYNSTESDIKVPNVIDIPDGWNLENIQISNNIKNLKNECEESHTDDDWELL